MRVLLLSKALVSGQYQTKLTTLAAQKNLELIVVVPPAWQDERGRIVLEKRHTQGYELIVAPIRFNGHFHLHYYPTINQILTRAQPDIFHIDEEPYNYATFHAARASRQINARVKIIFFCWQNILRQYPFPFAQMEQYMYRAADAAIAGSGESKNILQRKGFSKPVRVIPQFGVPDAFAPRPTARAQNDFLIGYAGRLVPEKGVDVLLRAVANLRGEWQLHIVGSGPEKNSLAELAEALGIRARVTFTPWVSSGEMPNFFNSLDVLVVPSLTRANWKEQFGRVLMEAMACGIPVIGSASGEIPNVIGDAGIVVPENDAEAITRALETLRANPALRQQYAQQGHARVLQNFSERRIAEDTYALYQTLMQTSAPIAKH